MADPVADPGLGAAARFWARVQGTQRLRQRTTGAVLSMVPPKITGRMAENNQL